MQETFFTTIRVGDDAEQQAHRHTYTQPDTTAQSVAWSHTSSNHLVALAMDQVKCSNEIQFRWTVMLIVTIMMASLHTRTRTRARAHAHMPKQFSKATVKWNQMKWNRLSGFSIVFSDFRFLRMRIIYVWEILGQWLCLSEPKWITLSNSNGINIAFCSTI